MDFSCLVLSHRKFYMHIYICSTQRQYNIYEATNNVKGEQQRVIYIIIPNGNRSCRRFFSVSGITIFRFPDPVLYLFAMSFARTYSGNGEPWICSNMMTATQIFSVSGENIFP